MSNRAGAERMSFLLKYGNSVTCLASIPFSVLLQSLLNCCLLLLLVQLDCLQITSVEQRCLLVY